MVRSGECKWLCFWFRSLFLLQISVVPFWFPLFYVYLLFRSMSALGERRFDAE
jgi:hypothetical protein